MTNAIYGAIVASLRRCWRVRVWEEWKGVKGEKWGWESIGYEDREWCVFEESR